MYDGKTYTFVYAIPDPVRDCVVRPVFYISFPSLSPVPAAESVHFKSERRREHNTEEDVILSEEEAIHPFPLVTSSWRSTTFRALGGLGFCRKGWGDLLVERSCGGRLPLKSLATSKYSDTKAVNL